LRPLSSDLGVASKPCGPGRQGSISKASDLARAVLENPAKTQRLGVWDFSSSPAVGLSYDKVPANFPHRSSPGTFFIMVGFHTKLQDSLARRERYGGDFAPGCRFT